MTIPDPLAALNGSPLHKLDIVLAERVTGVKNRSVSRHVVEPAVRRGATPANAVATLHWVIIATGVVAVAAAIVHFTRRN